MKKCLLLLLAVGVVSLGSGCATTYPVGSVFSNVKLPVAVTPNAGEYTKVGTAECTSYVAMIALGDASIEAAKKNGGITKVHHVDWEVENILGIIGKYKVIVYGD